MNSGSRQISLLRNPRRIQQVVREKTKKSFSHAERWQLTARLGVRASFPGQQQSRYSADFRGLSAHALVALTISAERTGAAAAVVFSTAAYSGLYRLFRSVSLLDCPVNVARERSVDAAGSEDILVLNCAANRFWISPFIRLRYAFGVPSLTARGAPLPRTVRCWCGDRHRIPRWWGRGDPSFMLQSCC